MFMIRTLNINIVSRENYTTITEEAIQSIHNYIQTNVTSFSFNYLTNYKI